jgi:helicase MOV-10
VIKLVNNFRSHSAILKFPNENFYDGDLKQFGDHSVINSFLGLSRLPAKKLPIVFHSISGKDDRESSSPSFFNIDEVVQVKAYVQKLRSDRRSVLMSGQFPLHKKLTQLLTKSQKFVADHDIGVITPYHAQCLKIRAALRAVADGIQVGSVKEFQGQVSV